MKLAPILETLQITNHVISFIPNNKKDGNLDSLITTPEMAKPDLMDFNIDTNQQYFSYEESIDIAENMEKFQKYIPIYTTCKIDESFLGKNTQDVVDAFKNGKSDTVSFDQSYEEYLTQTSKNLFLSISDQKLADRPAIIIMPVPSKKSLNVNLSEHLQQLISTKNKNTQIFNHYRKRKIPSFNTISRGPGKYASNVLSGEAQNKRERVYDQAFFSKLRNGQIDLDVAVQIAEQRKRKIEKTINTLNTSTKFIAASKKTIIEFLQEELTYLNSDDFEMDMLTASDKNSTKKDNTKEYTQNSGYYNEVKMLRDDFFETIDDFNSDMIHQYVKQKNPKKYSKKPLIIIVDDVIITRKAISQMYKHLVLNEHMTTDKYDVIVCAWAKKQRSKLAK